MPIIPRRAGFPWYKIPENIFLAFEKFIYLCRPSTHMEALAQLVRASDCGSEGRGFEPHMPPSFKVPYGTFFIIHTLVYCYLYRLYT